MPTPRRLGRTGTDDILVSDVMSRDVVCVPPGMELGVVAELFLGRSIGNATVVDAAGRAVGMIACSDLLRAAWDSEVRGAATVGDVMTPFAFALPATATIARAAALMASECVGRLVIVDGDGRPRGVLSSVEIMRWIAHQEGYLGAADGEAAAPRITTASHTVLVVDDDDDIREQLAEILGEEGYEVITAANGREALDRLREGGRPAVILMDLGMPVMDGWTLRAELKKDPRMQEIPVVLLSGQGNAREEARRLQADACLIKPVPYPTLLGTVQKFCAA